MPVQLREGFPGQRTRVLPAPLVAQARSQPVTSQLLVTDVGFYPRAFLHGRTRPDGADQHIVMVCVAGRGSCTLASGVHDVRAGDAVVIPAGRPHRYEAHRTDPWTIWWMHVVGEAVPALLGAMGVSPRRPVVTLAEPARVTTLIDGVLRRMERDETTSSLVAAAGAAWHALALMAADQRAVRSSGASPVEASLELLRANLAERFTVAELARVAGLSPSHFSVLFRRSTGFSAVEYQTRLRMAAARELLDTTDRSVAAVARQVGYEDPLYFSRQFRRIHSVSPTHYRSQERG